MDEISRVKQTTDVFVEAYKNRVRYSAKHGGWLVFDGQMWRQDKPQAKQIARQLCYEASRRLHWPQLDTEATVETVLRLASFAPQMTAIPNGISAWARPFRDGEGGMSNLAREATIKLGGEWHGHYGLAPGLGHGKNDRSLTIRPHRTDPDDIIIHSFAGDPFGPVKDELRRLGLPIRDFRRGDIPLDPVAIEEAKAKAREHAKERERLDTENETRRRWYANQLWKLRQPIQGTLAEAYLRIGRSFGDLPLPPLDMLGFLPAGVADRKIPYPAMIAAHGLPEEYEPGRLRIEEVSGVRLTFLDGPNKARLPELPDGRKAHGTCKGMPIVLAPPNDGLALCIGEGTESALSMHVARGWGAWATGSAHFMPDIADKVPGYIESITIWAEKGKAGQDGARELYERLKARGFEVRVAGVVAWKR